VADLRQHRSADICRTVWLGAGGAERLGDRQARNRNPLAPRGFSLVLAMEVKIARWSIIDIYKGSAVLATHPRIDRDRIAVMGFSRGAHAALYSSMLRFQKMYAPEGVSLSAYVTFYTPCNTRYIDDEIVSEKPIRLFHGTADDYNPVAPCRSYVERLRNDWQGRRAHRIRGCISRIRQSPA
jgi:predicted peptidase